MRLNKKAFVKPGVAEFVSVVESVGFVDVVLAVGLEDVAPVIFDCIIL